MNTFFTIIDQKVSSIVFLLVAMASSNCDQTEIVPIFESNEIKELIFGIDFAECGFDCATLFKLTKTDLFKDKDIEYIYNALTDELTFEEDPLPQNKFDLSKVLLDSFPQELWKEDSRIFGTPNAHDQGGILIEAHQNGRTARWYADTVEERIPGYLAKYNRLIISVLKVLRE